MVLDNFKMTGKTVVITGGAGLLGEKHAEAILEAGGNVVLLDVNSQALKNISNKLSTTFTAAKVLGFECDVSNESSVLAAMKECVKKFGKAPDVLINNAAIDAKVTAEHTGKNFSRIENFSLEQWNTELNVGLTGSLVCAKIFGSSMAERGSGVIINIASDLGLVAPDQRIYEKEGIAKNEQSVKPITYSVIKHGLIGLTKYLATYWAHRGVRCNAFAPGGVFVNHPDEFVQKLSNLIPMGRMGKVDEYKASILYLASDASTFMNGAVLVNDGGRSIW
jgi:NAD(P)-dependent dehydrogenase (short-subunit alcohol dehydrogenase family)